MEHSQANIDALRFDDEEADSRMFAHVSLAMELYSPGGVVVWNIVKLTDLSMKKQIRECFPLFDMPCNYIHHQELLDGT